MRLRLALDFFFLKICLISPYVYVILCMIVPIESLLFLEVYNKCLRTF